MLEKIQAGITKARLQCCPFKLPAKFSPHQFVRNRRVKLFDVSYDRDAAGIQA
jgi:hypothetical protein